MRLLVVSTVRQGFLDRRPFFEHLMVCFEYHARSKACLRWSLLFAEFLLPASNLAAETLKPCELGGINTFIQREGVFYGLVLSGLCLEKKRNRRNTGFHVCTRRFQYIKQSTSLHDLVPSLACQAESQGCCNLDTLPRNTTNPSHVSKWNSPLKVAFRQHFPPTKTSNRAQVRWLDSHVSGVLFFSQPSKPSA